MENIVLAVRTVPFRGDALHCLAHERVLLQHVMEVVHWGKTSIEKKCSISIAGSNPSPLPPPYRLAPPPPVKKIVKLFFLFKNINKKAIK